MPGRLYQPARIQPKPWYHKDEGLRLANDRAIVTQFYPGLEFQVDEQTQRISLFGIITHVAECGVPTDIIVRIVFPDDYPNQEPQLYDAANQFPHSLDRHIGPNGLCCLWLDIESDWDKNNPLALREFLDQSALFFDRQIVFDALPQGKKHEWPGGQRGHGVQGYIEFIRERLSNDDKILSALAPIFAKQKHEEPNMLCPCSSGKKYKNCHRREVNSIRQKLGFDRCVRVFSLWLTKTV